MLRRILFIGGACLGVALIVSPALGVRNLPKKANKYQATVVQGVAACTSTNTFAPGVLASPACDPVVAADPLCTMGEKGGGKIQAKAKDDISIKVKVKDIAASCEALTLCAVAGVRSSFDNCSDESASECLGAGDPADCCTGLGTGTCTDGGDCTTVDNPALPLGIACCTVEKGKCKIKTTLSTSFSGAVVPGNNSEFAVLGAGLVRTGLDPQDQAFRAGLLLP